MKKFITRILLAVCLTVLPASAAPFAIFDTGVDGSGNVLAGGVQDTDWNLVAPGVVTGATFTSGTGTPPVWLPDDTSGTGSRWITPSTDAFTAQPTGDYHFQTTFDLTGFVPSTASITGQWVTDNQGINILLNGVAVVGTGTATPLNDFMNYTNFAFDGTSNVFNAGVNTLTFVVNNTASSPVGLRVNNIAGDATLLSAVPELNASAAGTSIAIILCLFLLVGDRRKSFAQG